MDELGLADALRHLSGEWRRRNPGVDCSLSIEGDLDGLGEQTNITLYRVVQECLTNIARHARASEVRLHLERASDQGDLTLRIADDGVGIEPVRKKRGGLGLAGLRERVEALGGRLEVMSCVPHGVEVRASIPAVGTRP